MAPRRQVNVAGILLGAGLGGFVDGIVLHQILQWHHMLTAHGDSRYPHTSVSELEDNTRWDGVFHAGTWLLVVVGLALLIAASRPPAEPPGLRRLSALLLTGWGGFNLVEGVVNHHILTLHHVRDDVAEPLGWDLAFLASGVVLIAAARALASVRSE